MYQRMSCPAAQRLPSVKMLILKSCIVVTVPAGFSPATQRAYRCTHRDGDFGNALERG